MTEEKIDEAYEEFKRRLSADQFIVFEARSTDVQLSRGGDGFTDSMRIFFKNVLMPMPVEFGETIFNIVKAVGIGLVGIVAAIAGLMIVPILFVLRRIILLGAAFFGCLEVVPGPISMARHLNARMWKVRKEMERDGYDVTDFWKEIDPEQIDDDARSFLLRNWKR